LFRATNGKWYVGGTENMVTRKDAGWLVSTTASDSFLDLK